MTNELRDAIRQAGGIVHGDGNIFFTNAEQFRAAALASQAAEPASETAAGAVTDEQIRAVLDLRVGAMDGIEEVFVRNVRRVLSLATPPAATQVPSDELDALRRALEIIAVGDSADPVTDAGDEFT